MTERRIPIILWAVCVALVLLIALLSSCRSVRYVPVEHVSHDTLTRVDLRTDSVFLHDSTCVWIKGDTVREVRYVERYRLRELRDTVYQSRTDTVPVIHTVEVERSMTPWERVRLWSWPLLLLGSVGCGVLLWLRRKI